MGTSCHAERGLRKSVDDDHGRARVGPFTVTQCVKTSVDFTGPDETLDEFRYPRSKIGFES